MVHDSYCSPKEVRVSLSLTRIILYVQDVPALTEFYRDVFGLPVVEEIKEEWTVLQAGHCQLALHRAGPAFRSLPATSSGTNSNAKLVFSVQGALHTWRTTLIAKGISMGEIKAYAGFTGPLCDGTDPEGNVFQLAQA